jgi:predicted amidohydrolase
MTSDNALSRRLFLAAAAAGAASATSATSAAANAAAPAPKAGVSVPANGRSYARVPLRRDSVVVSAVQSRIRSVDGQSPAKGIRENLAHMIDLIDKTQYYGGRKDLLCFHEFPLQGWNPWDRAELERLSIDLPGEQTEALGAKAKEYGCYIQFGAYARDRDWPGHVLSVTSIIGPDGKLVARDWKARNIVGVFPDFELVTTTVYNVLDRFVEMYGVDALVPVHRTDIGNLATSSTQLEPEIFRVMALKGAELVTLQAHILQQQAGDAGTPEFATRPHVLVDPLGAVDLRRTSSQAL